MSSGKDDQQLYPCPLCEDLFTDPVWHCIGCAHHWLMSDPERTCKNCHIPLGERGTRKHKQKCVRLFLQNKVLQKLSDHSIAVACGVTGATVARIRKSNPDYQVDERVTKDGRVVSRERQASGADKRKKR